MNLYKELLIEILENQQVHILFPEMKIDINELLEIKCYIALNVIRNIVRDETLSDSESFLKIEEIIKVFERLGSSGGNRHNFI